MQQMLPEFDEAALADRLRSMPRWACLAFALDICDRVAPLFRRHADEQCLPDKEALASYAELGWSLLLVGKDRQDCRAEADAAGMLAPDTDEVQGAYMSDGLDAAVTVSRTLAAFGSDDGEVAPIVVEVAGLARDAADRHVQDAEGFSPGDDLESAILAHPIMQAELERQSEALSALCSPENQVSSVGEFRARMAERDALLAEDNGRHL